MSVSSLREFYSCACGPHLLVFLSECLSSGALSRATFAGRLRHIRHDKAVPVQKANESSLNFLNLKTAPDESFVAHKMPCGPAGQYRDLDCLI